MKIHLQKWGYHLLPHHVLSRVMGWFCEVQAPWFRQRLIRWFIAKYAVDMSLAAERNPDLYVSFNDFFTRKLHPSARPICASENSVACPADGAVSQFGEIKSGQLLQAKGVNFTVDALLGENSDAFDDGHFITVYLSPKDYHRVHMPYGGRLTRMVYIPGRLFSVDGFSAENIPGLFARNERVVCWFDTDRGSMVVVMVGAMLVASVHTVWAGQICPQRNNKIQVTDYQNQNIRLHKGDELGHFQLGSTVIVCFPKSAFSWQNKLAVGQSVQMGEALAQFNQETR